jgi:DNA-binding PadR family transcriptional regulator
LHRLERKGLIKARWGISDNNRKAKYYGITRAGSRRLGAATESWRKLTFVITQILET